MLCPVCINLCVAAQVLQGVDLAGDADVARAAREALSPGSMLSDHARQVPIAITI